MKDATTKLPVFYRTYARKTGNTSPRETEAQAKERVLQGLFKLGSFSPQSEAKMRKYLEKDILFCSGRYYWCGGTEFSEKPDNYYSLYNCANIRVESFRDLAISYLLLMMGCGVGAVLEHINIEELPSVKNVIFLDVKGRYGEAPTRLEQTESYQNWQDDAVYIVVGDSKEGWTEAYLQLINLALSTMPNGHCGIRVSVDVSNIRPKGELIKGFGGVTNPTGFIPMLKAVVRVLNGAVGRQLTPLEVSLLMNEAAKCTVAGNVRRSAKIHQFSKEDQEAAQAKTNLWTQDENGNWRIDPEKDALRMANFTRVWHTKPTLEEVTESVRLQYFSGEGAIMYAPEAIARANADILNNLTKKAEFLSRYNQSIDQGRQYLAELTGYLVPPKELDHRIKRYALNPCAEIVGNNFFCNLCEVHLNQIDPWDITTIREVFYLAGEQAASLLHHEFTIEKFRYSREVDPIVGVSFTGLFDFFVKSFGVDWLHWWQAGRPDGWITNLFSGGNLPLEESNLLTYREAEQLTLAFFRDCARAGVKAYCNEHDLAVPNRCTTVQPAGTKSLLTGASPGWHPPKSARYIRRITFAKDDPVALACLDYGYSIVPSQSDKDENGNLLNDPFDPRCTEWLVEIPVEVPWANLPGADEIDLSKFTAAAQFDFYMQIQRYYTEHNTSATIEFRESEINELAQLIYRSTQEDSGYISAALLARFDSLETFPRLPFEPITKEVFEKMESDVLTRRVSEDFHQLLMKYDIQVNSVEGPSGCDSSACLLPEVRK